jgi:uncharacterized protein YjbJ (UPF0337 family)
MNQDEIKGKAEAAKGRIKKGFGKLINDEDLQNRGEAQEIAGETQEALGRARRKVGETIEDLGKNVKR